MNIIYIYFIFSIRIEMENLIIIYLPFCQTHAWPCNGEWPFVRRQPSHCEVKCRRRTVFVWASLFVMSVVHFAATSSNPPKLEQKHEYSFLTWNSLNRHFVFISAPYDGVYFFGTRSTRKSNKHETFYYFNDA